MNYLAFFSRISRILVVTAIASTVAEAQTRMSSEPGPTVPERPIIGPAARLSSPELTIPYYEAAVAKDPNNPVLLNNLGVLLINDSQYEQAVEVLLKSRSLDPASWKTQLNLSVALVDLGRINESLAPAISAVEQNSKNALARRHLCDIYDALKRYSDSAGCFEMLVAMTPDDNLTKALYATALLRTGEFSKALSVVEDAASTSTSIAEVYNVLGAAQFLKNKKTAAVESFRRAVELNPDMPMYRFNLGVAQMSQNNRAAALVQYDLLRDVDKTLAGRLYKVIYSDMLISASDLTRQ